MPFCGQKNNELASEITLNFSRIKLNKKLSPIWSMTDKGERYHSEINLYKTPALENCLVVNESVKKNIADNYYLKVNCQGNGLFKITKNNITIDWQKEGTGAEHYFQTLAIALNLELNKVLCIHANALAYKNQAVALVAPSRTGKTTLTAALSQHGFGLMTDDMMALHHNSVKSEYTIYPSWPIARMWPDSLKNLIGETAESCNKVHQQFEKRIVEVHKSESLNFCDTPQALKTIYLLQREETTPDIENTSITKNDYCKITKVQPAEAVMILLQNSILGSAYKALAMEKSRLIALSNLLKNVHFKKISYSSGKSNLLNVCKAIKKDLAN